jgi:hypothetical protein
MRAWMICDEGGTKNKLTLTCSDSNYCCLWARIPWADLKIEHWSLDCCPAKCRDERKAINHDEGMNILWWVWHQNKLTRSDANYCCCWAGITCTDLQGEHWLKLDCCSDKYGDVKTTINRNEGMNELWWAWHQKQTYTHMLRCELLLWDGITWADLKVEHWS